jgi:uncharacterized Zn finger protein
VKLYSDKAMPASLLNNISRSTLRQLAGERSFERGQIYFDEERVRALVEFEGTIAATVEGTEDYRVKLWADEDSLGYSCDCPFADEGNFCKHCVAVGLALISEGDTGVVKLDDVLAFLERQDKRKLIEIILRDALDNERLCESLLLEVARANPGTSV